MSAERALQAAVARADLIVCTALRWLAVILPLSVALLLIVLSVRAWLGGGEDWIDYDAPGVDITSEGPDDAINERGMW